MEAAVWAHGGSRRAGIASATTGQGAPRDGQIVSPLGVSLSRKLFAPTRLAGESQAPAPGLTCVWLAGTPSDASQEDPGGRDASAPYEGQE